MYYFSYKFFFNRYISDAISEAQAVGMEKLLSTFGGDKNAMLQYLMLEKELYEKLAKTNADALQKLNPNMTYWHTTNGGDSSNSANPIADAFKLLPPLLSTIHEQTGIKLSDNLIHMPNTSKSNKE